MAGRRGRRLHAQFAPAIEPRLEPVPVRLPLPPASHQGSIYENQKAMGSRFFKEEVEAAETS